jgi:hypothetical protein
VYHVDQAILNRHLNHYRVIVENVNSRLKSWHYLTTRWRQSVDLYWAAFWLICQILNIDLIYRPIRVI